MKYTVFSSKNLWFFYIKSIKLIKALYISPQILRARLPDKIFNLV